MAGNIFTDRMSLLWTGQSIRGFQDWEHNAPDFDLRMLAQALSIRSRYVERNLQILQNLCVDTDVLNYRHDVLDDLMHIPELVDQFEELLEKLSNFDRYVSRNAWTDSQLHQVAYRMGELANYVECVSILETILTEAGDKLKSEALTKVRDKVTVIVQSEVFENLRRELPDILAKIDNVRSVTIGVNLNHELMPMGATLLSINDYKVMGTSSALSRLFRGRGDKPESEGVGPLHSAPEHWGTAAFDALPTDKRDDPLLEPLLKDLGNILNKVGREIASDLKHYMQVDVGFLVVLANEIAFYIGAVRLINRLAYSGLPMCRPKIAPLNARKCSMRDAFNVNFALDLMQHDQTNLGEQIVTNDVNFDNDGRIFILTGPNQGGKTVYTKAVGLAQVMFQAGLYVPATSAEMSPVDGIYTHFSTAEHISQQTGRLGEESRRLSAIFDKATPNSLILLNESLSSTSAGESFYLARDIVRVMRMLGTRAIYVTHLHELAADIDNINAETDGDSDVVSLISMIVDDGETRTYKIIPQPPVGKSYAASLAARYGISFDQLVKRLRDRKLL